MLADSRSGYEQVPMLECPNENGVPEEESASMVNRGGSQASLTTLGGLKESPRLSWRERNLGREVPMKLAGTYFDQAMKGELKKWADERCMRAIKRADARNLISGRFVLRWKPQRGGPNEQIGASSSSSSLPRQTMAEFERLLKGNVPVPKAKPGPRGTLYTLCAIIPAPPQLCPKTGSALAREVPGITGYKATARLCAHGFRDTDWWVHRSPPTARRETRRVGFTISLREGWRIFSLDAPRAFLQARLLSRRVCMIAPVQARLAPDEVWEIPKPVYGLNDAAHLWCVECKVYIVDLGFYEVPGDPLHLRDLCGDQRLGPHGASLRGVDQCACR